MATYPNEFEKKTVSSTPITLNPQYLDSMSKSAPYQVIITIISNSIVFRLDGQSPYPDNGHIADEGTVIILESKEEMYGFQMSKPNSGSSDAIVTISYLYTKATRQWDMIRG